MKTGHDVKPIILTIKMQVLVHSEITLYPCCYQYDSDGDLIVKRRKKSPQSSSKNLTIQIQHKTQTTLSDVGFQVWKGALFLADYLLENPGLLRDKTVLEIGSGTGLTAIAAKLCRPRRILATDLEPNLSLIRTNEAKNLDIATEAPAVELITLPLDVLDASPLKSIDEVFLDDVDVVLCADMIYDDDITKGTFRFSLVKGCRSTQPNPISEVLTSSVS